MKTILKKNWRLDVGILYLAAVMLATTAFSFWVRDLRVDIFDPDEYQNAYLVKSLGIGPYLATEGYGRPFIKLQYALAIKAARYDVKGPKYLSAIAGMLALLLVFVMIRKDWPDWFVPLIMIGFLLVYNIPLMRFNRWGMMLYSEYFLATSCFLFLMLYYAQNRETRMIRLMTLLLGILTPWIYFSTLIPVMAGIVLVWIYRCLQLPTRTPATMMRATLGLWPFGIAIISFLVASRFELFQEAGRRPTLFNLFYPTSQYPQTVHGALDFLREQTRYLYTMLFQVHLPVVGKVKINDMAVGVIIGKTVQILLVAGLVMGIFMPRRNIPRSFIAYYLLVMTCGIGFLSIVNQYPYGEPRYALYLLLPSLLLTGYGLAAIIYVVGRMAQTTARILRIPPVPRIYSKGIRLCWLAGIVCLIGHLGYQEARPLHQIRTRQIEVADTIKKTLRSDESEIALISQDARYGIRLIAPSLAERAINMGYQGGTNWAINMPSDDLRQRLTRNPPKKVLIATYHQLAEKSFPHYMELFPVNRWRTEMLPSPGRMYVGYLIYDPLDPALPTRIERSSLTIDPSGRIQLKGWVVSPHQVVRIEVAANGQLLGNATYPLRRPDVAKHLPQYRTDQCGYSFEGHVKAVTAPVKLTVRALDPENHLIHQVVWTVPVANPQ